VVQSVYGALSQGAPFPEVAAQFSDAPSAARGGFTGWLSAASIRPQVFEIVRQLEPGQISNPIRVPGGFQIVALVDRRDGQVVEQLDLYQLTVPTSRVTESMRADFEALAASLTSCEGVEERAAGLDGVIVTDLTGLNASALIPQIREALSGVEPVASTEVLETAAGLQAFLVCNRAADGARRSNRRGSREPADQSAAVTFGAPLASGFAPRRHRGDPVSTAPLALTLGDPDGVGPEIALKAWSLNKQSGAPFLLFADPAKLEAAAELLGLPAPQIIESVSDAAAVFPQALPVIAVPRTQKPPRKLPSRPSTLQSARRSPAKSGAW
jgi:hypothetical protein